MATNPMHQFQVHRIGPEIKIIGIDLSFTNASLFMLLSATAICALLFLGTREKKIIPDKLQLISEMFYNFIAKMITIRQDLRRNHIFHLFLVYLCLCCFVTCLECCLILSL